MGLSKKMQTKMKTAGAAAYACNSEEKTEKKGKHGMQMGAQGYGITHGYGPGEETEGNDHEYR